MERYVMAAQARVDELLELMSEEQRDLLEAWLEDNLDKELANFILTPSDRIQRLVGQTPAKDLQWVQKTARPTFVREWLAARHWAIASANALAIAAELADTRGRSYRKAIQIAVPVAERWLDRPSLDDLLHLSFDAL
ncbi:hypothetical protein [Paracoccus sp. (in: a-proteobacteria)]|uniref:hypothetical protein n=1 Tax=Paracoccus sp. TaxID=267 RepID=UPI0026DF1F70|nr:hypothetical protein [Paracoccus sp. (in: a-proteobacteria)]MDO5648910.1 hypothetical protein [Paracoccus sp. (in: a-proteobacteria)]